MPAKAMSINEMSFRGNKFRAVEILLNFPTKGRSSIETVKFLYFSGSLKFSSPEHAVLVIR
jgi:hypothetical protein